jgi:two-component system alkaline phosphatase synthesis response regulator PhoP
MIYCVEDESAIRDLMVYTLQVSGFDAQGFENDVVFWAAMKEQRPELIILDVMLPGEDGLTILRKLRSSPVTTDIPVIMATAKDSEYDKVIGLDSGADDYLAKPFKTAELLARINAVVRRPAKIRDEVLEFGGLRYSMGEKTLNGESLTAKEAGIIAELMRTPEKIVKKEYLLNKIWGGDAYGEDNYIEVYMSRVRKMLKKLGSKAQIVTIRGLGYKLVEE